MTETVLHEPDDLQWLKDTHLDDGAPPFLLAVIYGNEDCPEKVTLYRENHIGAKIATYNANENGDLIQQVDP